MTNYINTTTLAYPISEQQIRAAFPKTVFSSDFTPPSPFAAVIATARPAASDPITLNVVEDAPVNNAGVWTQTWKEVAASAEQIAERQESARYVQDAASAKSYAKLNAMKNMTPAQIQAWVDANVNNLADAKDALKTLAVAVSILARQL